MKITNYHILLPILFIVTSYLINFSDKGFNRSDFLLILPVGYLVVGGFLIKNLFNDKVESVEGKKQFKSDFKKTTKLILLLMILTAVLYNLCEKLILYY